MSSNGIIRERNFFSKWYYLVIILGVLILIIGISTLQADGKSKKLARSENQAIQNQNIEQSSAETKKLSAWNIIQMTDWLFWPFVVITTAGIMLIIYRTLFEHREKSRGQALLHSKINIRGCRYFLTREIHFKEDLLYSEKEKIQPEKISSKNPGYCSHPVKLIKGKELCPLRSAKIKRAQQRLSLKN